jgi:hypothetical protein
MTLQTFKAKSDAELMRFCAATSCTLDTLRRRMVASAMPMPNIQVAFNDLSERLASALAELEGRYA